ncbi:MAG: PAS domain S-box protein, partial [Burkholderiales bacterium]|nr:PAS domain S-box protein [Burkholderiales bacterium]
MQHPLLLQQLRTTLGITADSAWQHKLNLLRAKGEGPVADGLQMLVAVVEKTYQHLERQLYAQSRRADSLQEQLDDLHKDLQQTWRSLADSDAKMPTETPQLIANIRQLMLQSEAEHGALYASEARNRRLLEGLREIVFQSNARGHLTYLNPSWTDITGFSVEESTGQRDDLHNLPWQQQLHPDDWPLWQQHLKEHLKRQRPELDIELRFATKSGGWRHASLRGKVVLWRARSAVRMAGMLLDVTARKQAEEAASQQRELTEQILNQLPITIFLKDREGRFLRVNRQFEMLSGLSRENIVGKTVAEFSSAAWAEHSHNDDALAWSTGELVTSERRFRHSEPPLDLQINRIVIEIAPGQSYLLGFSIDITEQRAVRDALQQALANAQAASQAKSEFLANMSHEIRTPMNGILGMTELALETTLTRDQREYMTMVKSSADALLVIINDILDFSKIEAGKLDIAEEPFDLKKLVTETAKSMSLRAHEKELELRCDIPLNLPSHVRGDPGRLRQVLVNLLGNAIKFTTRGEVVLTLKVLAANEGRQEIEFAVTDSGIGIPR